MSGTRYPDEPKIYAQVACILRLERMFDWEMLHWFLKFLIPKLIVKTPGADQLDELLESVDLSTYGLERVRVNQPIELDASDGELEPRNPNPRGYHGGETQKDPMDEIIAAFNERFFAGWDATPEEQRVKLRTIAGQIRRHPNFQSQYADNPDAQNRNLAFDQMMRNAMNQQRRQELDLYRKYATDPDLKRAFDAMMMQIVEMSGHEGRGDFVGM